MAVDTFFRYDTWVKTTLGPAVPGAQVYVCTQPANVASAPPSPLALIYSDPLGLVPITQPIITDGFGHANFYALPGLYTVVIAFGGLIQQVYPDQSLGGVGTGGNALLLSTNGVPNANQFAQNLVGGTGINISDDGLGDITIASASVGSPSGSNVFGCPVLPDYTSSAGLNGFSIVMKVPASRVEATSNSGIIVSLWTATTTGLVVNSASIGATLPNSTTWTTTPVPFTFPAGSFVDANTLYPSNKCPIEVDSEHDYWIVVYIDPSSSGGNAYATLSSIPAGTPWYSISFRSPSALNYTNEPDASLLQNAVLDSTTWLCFGQITVD